MIGLSRTDRASAHIKQLVMQGGGSYAHLACDITQAAEVSATLEPQTDHRFGSSPSGPMNADAIAQAYLDLSAQHPSAWTHEMDLRPFSERF